MSSINARLTTTVTLGTIASAGTYTSPLTVTATASVIAVGAAIFGPNTQAWTIDNAGTLSGTGVVGNGVDLIDGGTVLNSTTAARITGDAFGVYITGAPGTVSNLGSIIGNTYDGVADFFGGSISNGATDATAALISGGQYGIDADHATITNFGTINGSIGGIGLIGGGTVDNGSAGVTSAVISGESFGIVGADSVTNYGTITATGTAGIGVKFSNGGSLLNAGTISGANFGVYIAASAGTVVNTGTITADKYDGIGAFFGGSVINGGTDVTEALIEGGRNGVYVYDGTVTNFGTITGTSDAGVNLFTDGTLVNGSHDVTEALVSGYYYGVRGAYQVTNFGTIAATGTAGTGIRSSDGAFIDNETLVEGTKYGIYVTGSPPATVYNFGTISGTGTHGTGIKFTGVASDKLVNDGLIAGSDGDAVQFGGGSDLLMLYAGASFSGSVDGGGGSNTLELAFDATTGTVSGIGTEIVGFGTIEVDLGAEWVIAGDNTIASGVVLTNDGILHLRGTLANSGTLTGTGSLTVDSGGTLINNAPLGMPMTVAGGGYVDNTATGTISGGNFTAIYGAGAAVTVVNAGSITNSNSTGIYLNDGGIVSNRTSAFISGKLRGIAFYAEAGIITNAGTITGPFGTGVYLRRGGTVFNDGTAALISGGDYGIYVGSGAVATVSNSGTISSGSIGVDLSVAAGSTVINAGTIAATYGDAVLFGGGDDTLVVDPGAVFSGTVDGGGGNNTLELAAGSSAGTISGLGTAFIGFDAVIVDSGATWDIGGSNALSGTLTNNGTLGGAGTLTLTDGTVINNGSISATVTLAAGGYVDNAGSGAISGPANGIDFTGAAGTVINAGSIAGLSGSGIDLLAGGAVTNAATGRISGYDYGIYDGYNRLSLTNLGSISSTGVLEIGVFGKFGGVVVNGATDATSALIVGDAAGLEIGGGSAAPHPGTTANYVPLMGTVINYGSIIGSGSTSDGVRLEKGGTVDNRATGLISGADAGIYLPPLGSAPRFGGVAGRVTNAGTIEGLAGTGVGIYLGAGGDVTNTGTAALISGGGYGVRVTGANASTVSNSGEIIGSNRDGVSGAQTVLNSGTITGGGARSGVSEALSVFNTGTAALISGAYTGASLTAEVVGSPSTIVTAGTLINQGTVTGGVYGAILALGSVVNGAADMTTARISGGSYGLKINNLGITSENEPLGGDVINFGTIAGAINDGILIRTSANVINGPSGAATALISGDGNGIDFAPRLFSQISFDAVSGAVTTRDIAAATVTNYGTVKGTTGDGVLLGNSGTVTNDTRGALISGAAIGIYVRNVVGRDVYGGGPTATYAASGVVTNLGTIQATGPGGVGVEFSGTVANAGTAAVPFGDTVINAGTITGNGGDAILFGGGDDLLIVKSGAVFVGAVDGGGGTNTVEFDSATGIGSISDLGNFINFTNIDLDSNSDRTVTGGNTIVSGTTLTNNGSFTNEGTLTIDGTFVDYGTFTNNGTLSGTGTVIVDPATLVNAGYSTLAIALGGGSYLSNTGTISVATGDAITSSGGPVTITNAGAISSGAGTGINLAAGGTIIDSGVISGNTAISFGNGSDNLLVLEHGYALTGPVVGATGAGATNTLRLQGTSSANAVTADYNRLGLSNFGTVGFTAGDNNYATLRITNSAALPGTISGFIGAHDIVDLTQLGDASNDATATFEASTNVLTIVGDNGSVVLQLDSEDYSGLTWIARNDGSGGTDVMLEPPPPPPEPPSGGGGGGPSGPTVLSVTASPSSGNLGTGRLVAITLTMNEAVTVSGGVPTLSLNDQGSAIYDPSASTSVTLVFDYIVAMGQNTSALAITAVHLNGAIVADQSGSPANFAGATTTFDALAVAGYPPGDFNSDGLSDVLLHDSTTGDTGYWVTNVAGQVTDFHDFADGSTSYQIAGIADFDGDARPDILWHDPANGDTGFWITDAAGQVTGFHNFGAGDPAYQIAGVGDFDGDGRPDILWHDPANGDTGFWITDAAGQVTGFHDFGAGDPAYQVAGVGDFDGDGRPDILWHNAATGDIGYWNINSSGSVSGLHHLDASNIAYSIVPA